MTSADPPVPAERAPEAELKHGAISFLDALVIGLASTSPAYSLAAIIGPVVALVGVYAPGVLLASFVPMLLIASAFYYLNKADQDCGTTFSWVTRAMGPWFGLDRRLGDRDDRRAGHRLAGRHRRPVQPADVRARRRWRPTTPS